MLICNASIQDRFAYFGKVFHSKWPISGLYISLSLFNYQGFEADYLPEGSIKH